MDTIRRDTRNDSPRAAQNVLVSGGGGFGLAVAECLTEAAQLVTFVSETRPVDITDSVKSLHRTLSGANDVRVLASESADTGVEYIDIPQILAERICGRYE